MTDGTHEDELSTESAGRAEFALLCKLYEAYVKYDSLDGMLRDWGPGTIRIRSDRYGDFDSKQTLEAQVGIAREECTTLAKEIHEANGA